MTKAEAGGTPGAPEAGRGRPDPPLEPPEGGGPGTPGSRLGRTPFWMELPRYWDVVWPPQRTHRDINSCVLLSLTETYLMA